MTVTKEDWCMFPISNALEQTREVREKQLQAKSLKIAVAVVFMAVRPNGVHVAPEDPLVAEITLAMLSLP